MIQETERKKQMKPGLKVTLEIEKKADYGYFLTDGESTILLHNSEIIEDISDREEVLVYLYVDHEERLAATMKMPKITEEVYDWVEVVDVVSGRGVYVDVGLSKDALVATEHLPPFESIWPKAGDKLYCMMKVTKYGRMFAKPAPEDVIKELFQPADQSLMNKELTGTVYRLIASGSFVISEEGIRGFIHPSQRKEEPRLGEQLKARVIAIKDDSSVNLSLLPRKQDSMSTDAEQIISYLRTRNGAMPFSDKSDPEDIKERFQMSKGAFKRALGHLMKQGKVRQEGSWTYEITKEK
ncbi:putative RNA-binding protein (virulence factor B family) [Bacillus capparidis]|nr:putative RNA-binding protein (virulence factor B family) [Bacillus capparidis]